ncbi:hypothetical protein HMPREF0863_00300 [Erysipelotrichaceae bacterium 5_2_54FAA]|nr:hypothetical protein HMPREF0863_00300 [Erysipelotrichaceae bacterium 5_2_54FAA]
MEFKDLVKSRRVQLGLTMEQVGRKVGVSKATVQRWESGEICNVRRDKIAKLANALQTTPAYLMGWDENEISYFSKNFEFLMRQNMVNLKIIEENTGIEFERLCSLINENDYPTTGELKIIAKYFCVNNSDMLSEPLYLYNYHKTPISNDLNQLHILINSLNEDGIKKVIEYIRDLSDKYRKND